MTTLKLAATEYRTLTRIAGPLLFIDRLQDVASGEIVRISGPDGSVRWGQVLEIDKQLGIVQVFSGTGGLDLNHTRVRFTGEVARLDVSLGILGRVFNGLGRAIDDGPPIVAEKRLDIHGLPLNPAVRDRPREFIQTGVSAIDGLNTLTRGQKLPIFSGAGLPANELAALIAAQARVAGGGHEPFAVVFAAIGITFREANYFLSEFEESGALDRTVVFINLAEDPAIERLFTPRAALTAAEYLAYTHGRQVLIILTDMTNYCEALREVSAAREEVPGRRGYPGYMYSDLASLYERAGRIKNNRGSVTQLIILTMPDDDITHPIPDLTGYITEGQIVLSRELRQQSIFPPIDVLPSLSRLMNAAIGEGHTRRDHRVVADQLYAFYAEGRDLRRLVAIVGTAALSNEDRRMLAFTDRFEEQFINQGRQNRSIEATLKEAWTLLSMMPRELLKRIPEDILQAYYQPELT
jgi:V/A-type H+-transporting ATPase subunit B